MQLLVDRHAHLLQLLRVIGAQQFQPLFDRRAHRFEPLLVALRQRRQAVVLHVRAAGELALQRLREMAQVAGELFTGDFRVLVRLGPGSRELGAKLAFQSLVLRADRLQSPLELGVFVPAAPERTDPGQRHGEQDCEHSKPNAEGGNQPGRFHAAEFTWSVQGRQRSRASDRRRTRRSRLRPCRLRDARRRHWLRSSRADRRTAAHGRSRASTRRATD